MIFLMKCVFMLLSLVFNGTNSTYSRNNIYLNCDLWDNSIDREDLTDVIWPNILENVTDADQLTIDYGNCGISTISETAFEAYSQITYLSLERNKIQLLERDTFYYNNNLEVLKLNNNRITILRNGVFDNLRKVQNLYLQYNQIRILDMYVFRDMFALTILHLEKNKLSYIDKYMFYYNQKLEYLNIKNNRIAQLNIIDLSKSLGRIRTNGHFLFDNITTLYRNPSNNNSETKTEMEAGIQDEMELESLIKTTHPPNEIQMTLHDNYIYIPNEIIIYCSATIFITIVIIVLIICAVKFRNRRKKPDVELYDVVKNPSICSEKSYAYVEANSCHDKTLLTKFCARKLSYLESKVSEKNPAAPFQRNESYLSVID